MKLRSPTLFGLGALCIASVIRRWMSTCDYRMTYYDASVDPFHPDHSGHGIYVLWHEYLLLPVMVRSHSHLALLLSRHADAEILARVTRHYGFECVRGSSNKGSVAALNELFEKSRSTGIAITISLTASSSPSSGASGTTSRSMPRLPISCHWKL